MAVQKGRLDSTDTTKNMQNYYSDAVVTTIADVDRAIHNGTQFVRLVLQRPQPIDAFRASDGSPDVHTDSPHYIDGLFTENPAPGTEIVIISFANNLRVATNSISVYSSSAIDDDTAKWQVAGSLSNIDDEYADSDFQGTISTVTASIVSTPAGNQFKYVVAFSTPAIDTTAEGFPFWRVKHDTSGEFAAVTEVEPLVPLTPTISYFNTDGTFASSFPFAESNILDACFDNINDVFFTIRFNNSSVGTVTINLGEDFSDAEAGTAAATNNFNPARWDESATNSQFLRIGEQLSYNAVTGLGQLETTYVLENDHIVDLFIDPVAISSRKMWLALRTLDTNNNTIMSEGFGYDNFPTTTGVVFNSYISDLTNSTANSQLREFRPLWHNTQIGTDSFTIAFSGSIWTVTGTLTGALSDANTGVTYDETVDATTPFSMIVTSTANPTTGEQFTFDLVTSSGHRTPTATGTVGFDRIGDRVTSLSNLTDGVGFPTGDVSVEIFGSTDGAVNFQADDYTVSGTATFPDVAVFTVEKTDGEGDVVSTPLIDAFDIIGDPSRTYNTYLDGRVQIACTSSGLGGGFIYIKVDNILFKYPNNISLGTETGSGATITTTAEIAQDGTNSFNWTHRSGIGGLPFLTYLEFDEVLDILHLRTLDKDTLLDTTDVKEVLLNISTYDNTINPFKVFFDQNDFDTLYYVDAATNLQSFNIDDRISAFMAVNAEDVTLPAGTSQQTFVNADVINAWGEFLNGKIVTFAVTAGDGAVSPSTDTTVGAGRATTQFTVGSTVGVSTITATVTET